VCLVNNVQSKSLFIISQVALLLFFLLQLPARHYPTFHPDFIDATRGLLLGIVIGLLMLHAWRNRHRPAA
jgi:uncharacterized membrane protein YccC